VKDYYKILEVSPKASEEEIKKQHKFLLHAWHPDKFPDPSDKVKATKKTREIIAAYEELNNRGAYDYDISTLSTSPSRAERADPADKRTVCANHSGRETGLSCNRCGKFICAECARKTPVGYSCPQCVREQRSKFETARWHDYLLAAGMSLLLSWFAGAVLVRMGWFVIFLAPTAGGIISELIRRAVGHRRGRYLSYAAVGGMLLAGIFNLSMLGLIYLALAASTLYARLRSMSI